MGRISLRRTVKAQPEDVFGIARNIGIYPTYMDSLKRIELLEQSDDGRYVKARWHAEAKLIMKKRQMCWVQEDIWDDADMMCESKLNPCEPGHYKYMNACWKFRPHPSGTEMYFDVDFQVAHPLVTPAIHKLIDALMERNNVAMLESIKKRAESSRV